MIWMLVTESMLLALVGGALAVGLSLAVMRVVVKLNPSDIPRFEDLPLGANEDLGFLVYRAQRSNVRSYSVAAAQ
jgi:hypothetical protein